MLTSNLTLQTADGEMAVFDASPEAAPRGGVIVIQEAFGVNDHMKHVTERFAAAGYRAVCPALFHRSGGGTAAYGDMEAVMKLFEGLTDDGILADADACLEHLAAYGLPAAVVGVVGFCFGGRAAFLLAARRSVGASVGFYGGGIVEQGGLPFPPLIAEAKTLQTPFLGLFGEQDSSIPVDQVGRLERELAASAPVDQEVVRYPGVGHGFHCEARPAAYDREAAEDGWNRTLDWLDRHLGRPADA